MQLDPKIDWIAFQQDIRNIWPRRRDLQKVIPIASGTLNRFWLDGSSLPIRFYLALCKMGKLDPFAYLKLS